MSTWTLQDAKARFSELVNRAKEEGPQVVTRHGEETVVVVPIAQYRRLTQRKKKKNLAQFLQDSPLRNLPEEFLTRTRDTGRKIEL